MAQQIIEGTWEEIKRHDAELAGKFLRVTVRSGRSGRGRIRRIEKPSALGKYAFVAGGSEAFAAEKQSVIALEDRSR